MATIMILAHLLGDYLFQTNEIARWKARSIWGVLAHGGIVTITGLACTGLAAPCWWQYALLIGLIHTLIDVVRARLLRITHPKQELIWYLADQLAHLAIIGLVVAWGGDPRQANGTSTARLLFSQRVLIWIIGYLLLAQPTWIFSRMVVRSVWGAEAAPCLGQGEKYGPMLERFLIATAVLLGQFYLVPLVLLPRRLVSFRITGNSLGILVHGTGHLGETGISALVAIGVGLMLRTL